MEDYENCWIYFLSGQFEWCSFPSSSSCVGDERFIDDIAMLYRNEQHIESLIEPN